MAQPSPLPFVRQNGAMLPKEHVFWMSNGRPAKIWPKRVSAPELPISLRGSLNGQIRLVNSMRSLDAALYCSYNITCEDRLG